MVFRMLHRQLHAVVQHKMPEFAVACAKSADGRTVSNRQGGARKLADVFRKPYIIMPVQSFGRGMKRSWDELPMKVEMNS